jgi:hypothetical protein
MIRNLKVLGLAVAAVMALGAFSASSALAIEFHSDSSTGNTWLTGETDTSKGIGTTHIFDAAGSTITCQNATFKGTQTGNTAPDVTMEAAYSNCTVHVSGFSLAATVNMNGCRYTFLANGEVAVVNAVGKNCTTEPITYRVSNFLGECDVKVGAQANLKSVTYDGNTTVAFGDVVVTPNVTGISGTSTGNLCSTTGAFSNGAYTQGATTVRGFVDKEGKEEGQTAIWVA